MRSCSDNSTVFIVLFPGSFDKYIRLLELVQLGGKVPIEETLANPLSDHLYTTTILTYRDDALLRPNISQVAQAIRNTYHEQQQGDDTMITTLGVVKSIVRIGTGTILGILAGFVAGILAGIGIAILFGVL